MFKIEEAKWYNKEMLNKKKWKLRSVRKKINITYFATFIKRNKKLITIYEKGKGFWTLGGVREWEKYFKDAKIVKLKEKG